MIDVALEQEAVRPETPCIFSRSVCPSTGAWIDLSPYLDRAPMLIFDTTPFDRAVEMVCRRVGCVAACSRPLARLPLVLRVSEMPYVCLCVCLCWRQRWSWIGVQVRGLGLRYLLVTCDGRLVGIIKKKDLLEHLEYHRSLRHNASVDAL